VRERERERKRERAERAKEGEGRKREREGVCTESHTFYAETQLPVSRRVGASGNSSTASSSSSRIFVLAPPQVFRV
jgi:hypothetical protein